MIEEGHKTNKKMLAYKGPRVVILRNSKAIALCVTNWDIVQRIVKTVKHK